MFNIFLHLDTYLVSLVNTYGSWVNLLVFIVIFCETGLVIFPFLPGDSLLFTLGALAAQADSSFNISFLLPSLIIASILGNWVNYRIGHWFGPAVLSSTSNKFINQRYLQKSHDFYEKHGGKTIIMARFIPIIRTFAPFIAGVSHMNRLQFHRYNVASAVLWIGSILSLGYFLSALPFVRDHFNLVIYSIIAISLLPPFFSFFQQQLNKHRA